MANKPSTASLADLLGDPAARISDSALRQLSDIDPAELRAILPAWQAMDDVRRRETLARIADLFEADTRMGFEDLARALLTDSDPFVRMDAVRLLAESEDPNDAARLIAILDHDPDLEPRLQAAGALGFFVELGELEELDAKLLERVEGSLLKTVEADAPVALRRAALESLGYSSRPEAVELISRYLAHHDPQWIESALTAAARSGESEWDDQVLEMITSPDDNVRLAAAEAAGTLNIDAARPLLLRLLEDEPDSDIYMAAIWSLSQIGGEDVEVTLESLLDQAEDDDLASFIEEALENLTFTQDMEDFSMLALDPDDAPGDQ
jgi:HEAT repeat protein